jgi:hypothetical protein
MAAPESAPDLAQEPAPLPSRTIAAHIATFRGNQLDECTDIAVKVVDKPQADAAVAAAVAALKSVAGDGAALSKACLEQFVDRTVLATCKGYKDATEKRLTISFVSSYFNVATVVDSDRYMQDCLKLGGDWSAMKHDDGSAARERARQHANRLLNIAQQTR